MLPLKTLQKIVLCASLIILLVRPVNADSEPVSLVVAPDVLVDYELFLRGRTLDSIDTSGQIPRRDVLEMIVLVRALRASGLEAPLEFVVSASLERHVALLKNGGVALSGAMINLADLDADVDVVQKIDFDAGGGSQIVALYASPNNTSALNAESIEDIQKLSAASNRGWRADWRALEAANLRNLVSVSDWVTMSRIVAAQRVDFLIAPFRPDGSSYLETAAGRLSLIKGFGLVLSSERRYVVSQAHPRRLELAQALTHGIASMGADDFWIEQLKKVSASKVGPEGLIIINPVKGRQAPSSTRAYQQ